MNLADNLYTGEEYCHIHKCLKSLWLVRICCKVNSLYHEEEIEQWFCLKCDPDIKKNYSKYYKNNTSTIIKRLK